LLVSSKCDDEAPQTTQANVEGDGYDEAMLTFLHTSDWQLGMTRAWFDGESQARYTDDQFISIRTMARVATEKGCSFVVVAGDVFDSIQPDRKIIARAIEALTSFTIPVYLVPGNHDADTPGAFWTTSDVLTRLPVNIHVLRNNDPTPVPGTTAEVVGVPWPSKRPDRDLVAEALKGLEPTALGVVRVIVGHGAIESFDPDRDNPSTIRLEPVERGLAQGLLNYLALGDRHSAASAGSTGAIHYCGAPVMTDFDEQLANANQALIVRLDGSRVDVAPVRIGGWQFLRETVRASGDELVSRTDSFLAEQPQKDKVAVRLDFEGTISLEQQARLEEALDHARDLFASITVSEGRSELAVIVNASDIEHLDLSGFARAAFDELRDKSGGSGGEAGVATDALLLLYRLALRS
jgi:DNA repair exonuclease SbcCD nuclease subunit